MTMGELVALLVAAQAMETYRSTSYAPALASAFEKIVAALDLPVTLAVNPASLPRFTGPPPRLGPRSGRPATAQRPPSAQATRGPRGYPGYRIQTPLKRAGAGALAGGDPRLVAQEHRRRRFRTFGSSRHLRLRRGNRLRFARVTGRCTYT